MVAAPVFAIESIANIGMIFAPPLDAMYMLSPFVWRDGELYRMLLRVVNHADDPHDKIARIHYASSADSVTFVLDSEPAIAPGPQSDDRGGCEDPTFFAGDDAWHVFYSGWNAQAERGSLLLARGHSERLLEKLGPVLPETGPYRNAKEASVVRCADGSYCLFFEYVREGGSQIGVARSPAIDGPWVIEAAAPLEPRPDSWDSYHLSPGPVVELPGSPPVMFYNGAQRSANWRIGCAVFDQNFRSVLARSEVPLIGPPPVLPDEGDMAFVASAFADGDAIAVYYSVADKIMKRALLRRT